MSISRDIESCSGMDSAKDPNLSLMEKLRLHAQKKRQTGIAPSAKALHVIGPFFYLFTIVGGSVWTFVDVLPTLYVDQDQWLLLPMRILLVVLALQVAVNWTGIRWVGSLYNPALHGTKPEDFPDADAMTARGAEASSDHKRQTAAGSSSTTNGSVGSNGGAGPQNGELAPKSHNGYSFTMLVATALPTADGEIERKRYPYWSWVPCLLCQRLRPPRCHHCTLCGGCVLKRDHHCYFTGRCVSVNNYRFFLVFLPWSFLLTSFGTYHFVRFVPYHMMPRFGLHFLDLIFPVSLLRGLLGYINPLVSVQVLIMSCILFCNVFSLTMTMANVHLLLKGKTSFEQSYGIKVTDTRSVSGKLLSVFGAYWWVNFLVPLHPWCKAHEDAVHWPHIKPC